MTFGVVSDTHGLVDRPALSRLFRGVRPAAAALIAAERPTIVVSGHSHKGHLEVRDEVLFINPGSAGRKRFKLLRSAGLLVFKAREVEARLLSLEGEVGSVVSTVTRKRRPT